MGRTMDTLDINAGGRERIRIEFYRKYRSQPGLSSVVIRRDGELGPWFLDVGVTRPIKVPPSYDGLEVRSKQASGAINAVARFDQVL